MTHYISIFILTFCVCSLFYKTIFTIFFLVDFIIIIIFCFFDLKEYWEIQPFKFGYKCGKSKCDFNVEGKVYTFSDIFCLFFFLPTTFIFWPFFLLLLYWRGWFLFILTKLYLWMTYIRIKKYFFFKLLFFSSGPMWRAK